MHSADTHIPVLMREALDALQIREDGIYVDATLGRGGHSQAIAAQLGEGGKLIAIDRDPQAIQQGKKRFAEDERVTIIHGDFNGLRAHIRDLIQSQGVDGILMDLGVSSPQLDQAERGFSFMRDGQLDMRMDPTQGESAADWLARVEEADLVRVLFTLGEEKFARRIARAIIVQRDEQAITSTLALAQLIEQSIPKKDKHKHPATRTFQAIRMFVNQELEQISAALPQAVDVLTAGGRLAVISFHSLEDRLVKRFMRKHATPDLPPKSIPVTHEAYRTPLTLVGKAIKPGADEVRKNPRARSSVLRVAERTSEPFGAEVIRA